MSDEPTTADEPERRCPDDYVHDCHQVPFTSPQDTRSCLLIFAATAVALLLLAGLVAYGIYRLVF